MSDIVIEMTPFVYEDGKTYYFEIYKRRSSNDFHDLYVYKKLITKKSFLWRKWEIIEYKCFNEGNAELVSVSLNSENIKLKIEKILNANSAMHQIKNWDGFVGNVPDDIKKALQRDSKLDELLGE
jgi:hypothetical protein